jgi:endonuclease/exonuclease/phosphatase family metal-dependent hydrolase
MSAFFRRLLILVNVVSSLFLLVAYCAPWLPPDDWWFFSFIGTGTTYLMLGHLLYALLWLPISFAGTAVNVFLICSGFGLLSDTIQWNYPDEKTHPRYRIISCNVGVFSYQKKIAESLIGKLIKLDPDILCIQEFYSQPGMDAIRKITSRTQLKYYAFYPVQENYGLITFSKYPIRGSQRLRFSVRELGTNGCLYTDIQLDKKRIRVYNTHLTSMRIQKHLKEIYEAGGKSVVSEQDDILDVISKMRLSWRKQVPMCEELKAHMNASDYPVILCGDMNATPYSYIVRRLGEGLEDSYRQKGRGLGFSFRSNFPLLRIDYVFYDRGFKVLGHDVPRMLESDHFPVVSDFGW